MASHDWDFFIWHRASDLLQQAGRIHRNFLQVAASARYQASPGRSPSWEPPVNVVETDESLWVISAIPGVAAERVDVRLDGRELIIAGIRPLPNCCAEGELKIGKSRSAVLSGDSGSCQANKLYRVGEISFRDGLLIIELRKHA